MQEMRPRKGKQFPWLPSVNENVYTKGKAYIKYFMFMICQRSALWRIGHPRNSPNILGHTKKLS